MKPSRGNHSPEAREPATLRRAHLNPEKHSGLSITQSRAASCELCKLEVVKGGFKERVEGGSEVRQGEGLTGSVQIGLDS